MTIDLEPYRINSDKKVNLSKWPTKTKPVCQSKKAYKELLQKHTVELRAQQRLLYASSQHALLILFQGMDAAGKDGAIGHVLTGINPEGCEVFSFKQPSAEELEHDFLWRTTCRLPARGRIGVFNRSYYEEVLVPRVHPETLRGQGLPAELLNEKDLWDHRYDSIVDLEKHLHRNGTKVVKIFLHLSLGEQRQRFLERIQNPEKNWKLGAADTHERTFWKQYQSAYEDCFQRTSSHRAPWYIVPADDKEDARLIVAQIVLSALEELKMSYPNTTAKRRVELQAIKKSLGQ